MPASFTVIIPTHNRRETVVLAVASALRQTRPPEQVIVVCDGCGDGTADAVAGLGDARVEVLDLPKLPGYGYGHRNAAVEQARGDVIAWLADDDLHLPEHLERVGDYWDAVPADIVTTPAVVLHPDDRLEWFGEDLSVPAFRDEMQVRNTCPMTAITMRPGVLRDAGGWDAAVLKDGDWDLWRRCLATDAVAWTTAEPTALHIRARGRAPQPWPDRVRQNTEWLNRMGDPDGLAAMRRQLRRLRGVRDAERIAEIVRARDGWAQAIAGRDVAVTYAQSLEDERERLRAG